METITVLGFSGPVLGQAATPHGTPATCSRVRRSLRSGSDVDSSATTAGGVATMHRVVVFDGSFRIQQAPPAMLEPGSRPTAQRPPRATPRRHRHSKNGRRYSGLRSYRASVFAVLAMARTAFHYRMNPGRQTSSPSVAAVKLFDSARGVEDAAPAGPERMRIGGDLDDH